MKKVIVIISLMLAILIIGCSIHANMNNDVNTSSYEHTDTFVALEKQVSEDNNNTEGSNTSEDIEISKPEVIESTPIEEYDTTDYKGDADFESVEDKKYKISDNTENGYQDWMFDYTSGDTFTTNFIVKLYNTYADNFGTPETFNISDKKLDTYYGNAGYYIFNIDGVDYCFMYDADMEYVYIYSI